MELRGKVYYDGSCDNRGDPILSRASWGIVEVSDDGDVLATFSGNVPATMPQTPQSGEHIAHAFAVEHLARRATLSGDCKGVVAAAQDQSDRPLNRKRLHAAATRAVRTSPAVVHVAE